MIQKSIYKTARRKDGRPVSLQVPPKAMGATKVTPFNRLMWICNTLFHQSLAVVSVFILWIILYNNQVDSEFTWHMVLSTLAYIPLMGEAIVLFASDNVWSQNINRTTKYYIHGVILFISAALASAGMGLEVKIKIDGNASHFVSIHAWTGLVSWIFILLSQILGIAAARAQNLSRIVRPVYVKFLHNLLGLLGYIFGIVSLAYGLYTGAFSRLTSPDARLATVWVLGLTTLWSILAALKSGVEQIRAMFT